MPRRALTDRFCAHAKARAGDTQTDYFDEAVAGLALRIGAGTKSWTYHFTWGGKRVRMTLGTYPATSLGSARAQADEAKANLEAGRDPRSALRKPDTLKAVCEEYLAREGASLRTLVARKATLERLVYHRLGDHPINEVRRSDVVRLLDVIEDERGPVMADKTLASLRRVFNWYASRSDDFRSPIVRGMSRTSAKDRARARVLTDDEIRVVWRAAEGQGAFGRMVRFLLLTGARRTEAAAMAWAELDGGDWTLPGARNKTKLDLVRPLPTAALTVIGARPDSAVFVFSNDGGDTAVRGYGPLKAKFDRAVLAGGDPQAQAMPNWTLHDLRRTARSLMSRAGVPSDYGERVLGHTIGGVRATYDRHDFIEEKRQALAKLAYLIDRIITNRPTLVKLVRRHQEAEPNG